MTTTELPFGALREAGRSMTRAGSVFLRDVGHGLLEVSHNTLALLGLMVVAVIVFVSSRADLRQSLENRTLSWLKARHEVRTDGTMAAFADMAEQNAILRATAADPKELTTQQAAVAQWISRRYRVAPEPISRLVKEAWTVGAKVGVDPTLILAIMAIESGFNPFAQSPVGAQGLMQVMTQIHDDKYEAFGGIHAAFDPVTNLRVGVQVLKECMQRAGGLEAGLRFYVGAANLPDDGGYAGKVLAEQEHLKMVAAGKNVPVTAPLIVPPAPVVPVSLPATVTGPEVEPQAATTPSEKPAPDRVALAHAPA